MEITEALHQFVRFGISGPLLDQCTAGVLKIEPNLGILGYNWCAYVDEFMHVDA